MVSEADNDKNGQNENIHSTKEAFFAFWLLRLLLFFFLLIVLQSFICYLEVKEHGAFTVCISGNTTAIEEGSESVSDGTTDVNLSPDVVTTH